MQGKAVAPRINYIELNGKQWVINFKQTIANYQTLVIYRTWRKQECVSFLFSGKRYKLISPFFINNIVNEFSIVKKTFHLFVNEFSIVKNHFICL